MNNFYIRAMGENDLFKISDFGKLNVAVDTFRHVRRIIYLCYFEDALGRYDWVLRRK